jgi:ribonuclease-3
MNLEQISAYKFKDHKLLVQAFTHPSMISEANSPKNPNYERLEFLGDTVLELVITELLIQNYPKEQEGDLAKRRAALVSGEAVAKIALRMNLGSYLIITSGEEMCGGRSNPNNLENALEALIGALYIDGGLKPAQEFVHKYWSELMDNMPVPPIDAKTALQEWAQKQGKAVPEYITIKSEGPSHLPIFTVEVRLGDLAPCTYSAKSKKEAERGCAEEMLQQINAG